MPDLGLGWQLAAPAKLNLWLAVVGRRPDGFHELVSGMVLLELADALSFEPDRSAPARLVLSGPAAGAVPAGPDNLAWRGWAAGSSDMGGTVTLEKHLPAAAGLGGGSSDAAAAWRLARRASGRPDLAADDPAALRDLATIGADIPFFAAGFPAAVIRGIGERVEAAGLPAEREVVLVHPPFELSTAAVFAELRAAEWSPADDPATGTGPLRAGRNDLEPAARRLRPELADVLRIVTGAGGDPHLTGSGPTVFILTDDAERADGVAARVQRAGLAATRTRLRAEPASIEPWNPTR